VDSTQNQGAFGLGSAELCKSSDPKYKTMPTNITHISRRKLSNLRKKLIYFHAKGKELWMRRVVQKPTWHTDRDGITCRLYPTDDLLRYFSGQAFYDDPATIAFLRRIVYPGMIIFDVGAHWGEFSLLTARLLCGKGEIHAFEPSVESYDRLIHNIDHNKTLSKSIILNHAAIYNTEQEVTLYTFPPHLSGWNSLGRPTMDLPGGGVIRPTGSEPIRSTTIDAYCHANQIARIDLLKIDVEGYEDDVIVGCQEMISKNSIPWVIFEISLDPLRGANKSPLSILQKFTANKFDIFLIANGGGLRKIEDTRTFEVPYFANYFAVHAGIAVPL
jgi:FkbM family methyltransferase